MDHQDNSNGDSIQVVVRIKPGCQDEAVIYTQNQIKLDRHSFAFDRIFGPNAQQDDIYSAVGKKLLTHTIQGYNSCIFVYGQTGSGKTYTMMGNNNGMMQRCFGQLFSRIDRMSDTECIVTCSYFELYNEQIIDLLDKGKDKKNLNIRQDVKRGVFIEHLTEEQALNSQRLLQCLMTGMKSRHIGQTQMNRESSRSHSIFTISLAIKSQIDGKKVLKTPKLHFVDLAGSQRQKMTMATGDRLKQAGNINKSLTTLGMVINALASDKPKVHIPYRDSKLTCLLRDSLGGNSKTFIVATISTSMLCFQQTLSTLNFANRAKMVKVKALVNQQSLSTNLEQYKQEIRRLKQQIHKLKSEKRVNFQSNSQSVISKNNIDLSHKFELITNKIQDLKSNMMNNASMDSLIQKMQQNHCDQMMDEGLQYAGEPIEQQGNELIQYMVSNHDLMKKIHSTMSQYRDLKEQIKSVEFNRRMPMEDMRTPSKFQRDQYEDLLMKRQNHIKQLQQKIISLKEINFKRDLQIKQNKKKLSMSEFSKIQQSEQIERLRADQYQQQRRLQQIQMKYDIITGEKKNLKATIEELQSRLKQSKQLYLYQQQKYENEKFMRCKLQSSIKDLTKKHQHLQGEKNELIDQLKNKVQMLQQTLLQGERREEEYKNQQQILNETLQFNKRKMKEYADKLQQANKQLHQYQHQNNKIEQTIVSLQLDAQRMGIDHQIFIDQMNSNITQLKNINLILEESLTRTVQQKTIFSESLASLRQQHKNQIQSVKNQISGVERQKINLLFQVQDLKSSLNQATLDHEIQIFGLQKNINTISVQLQSLKNWKMMMEEKYETDKSSWQDEKSRLATEIQTAKTDKQNLQAQIAQKQKTYAQMENFVNNNRNFIEDFQQLKKTYKQVIKQNYRLKGQYHTSNNLNQAAKNEQLASKVTFYQEKFKLMSIEFNKSQETIKKLKQKQLTLQRKVEFHEENQKLKRIHSFSQAEQMKSEKMKALQIENEELKESVYKIKSMYEVLLSHQKTEDYSKRLTIQNQRYQLSQQEEKIRKRLESAIKNWDHAKENNCEGMTIDQLFNCWQKIQSESRKKFQGIVKAIKRQQRLKSQNSFILKENFFLKEKLQSLQKQMSQQCLLGNPRKISKPNEQSFLTQV